MTTVRIVFKQQVRWLMLLGCLFVFGCSSSTTDPAIPKGPTFMTYSQIGEAQRHSKGDGVRVAIIDWQFDMRGEEAEKYVEPVSMVPGEGIGELKPWHGEWMAEIVHEIAPEAEIIPIRARSLESETYSEYLIQGIHYAADHGAVAVSSSMGPMVASEELRAAIDHAEASGMVFVNVHPEFVVGNDGKTTMCMPGECDPRIIRTGVVSVPDHPAQPAPNRDIYTWPYDLEAVYQDGWGYSNAPPIVLGVIALMHGVHPELTPGEARDIIKTTAVEKDGFMVLDAEAATTGAAQISESDPLDR
jgi:hypothetical protein